MIFSPKTVEESIIYLLQKGSFGTTDLLKKVNSVREGTTKQAFYQSLRKLKMEEVVVQYSKRVSLSHIWVQKMSEFFDQVSSGYSEKTKMGEEFLLLNDGEKIAYSFKNPKLTDIFWGHAFGILSNTVSLSAPLFIYNPHDWFMVARRESERKLFDQVESSKRELYYLVKYKDPLDIATNKEYKGEKSHYFASGEEIFKSDDYYFNIFGDFIIEAFINQNTANEINKFYKENYVITKENLEQLIKIIEKEGKNKLVISRNHRKAEKLKKIFKKYFLVK